MFETYKITTTRGEVHAFGVNVDAGKLEAEFMPCAGGEVIFVITKNGLNVAMFPARNVESVVRSMDVDGEVAS